MIIRTAIEADATALQAFSAELIAERLPVLFRRDQAPTVEHQHDMIRRLSATPRSALFVAESDGQLVGMLDFHGHQKPQRAHAGEFGMSVAKTWRNKGVGTRLLNYLSEWAIAEGLRRLELSVFSNNDSAIVLYRRCGFIVEGRQQEAVLVDGAYVDIVLMAKLL